MLSIRKREIRNMKQKKNVRIFSTQNIFKTLTALFYEHSFVELMIYLYLPGCFVSTYISRIKFRNFLINGLCMSTSPFSLSLPDKYNNIFLVKFLFLALVSFGNKNRFFLPIPLRRDIYYIIKKAK